MASQNPASRLSATPTGGCLPEVDGRLFFNLIQAARLAANSVSHAYPKIQEVNQLVFSYQSQEGQMVLAHLSALMYTYWDNSPSGPSVFELARDQLVQPFRQIFSDECSQWGKMRLNAPTEKIMYFIKDTQEGSIVADHTMTKFYKVLGLKRSPGATLTGSGVQLPASVRMTALPFRGVLVYDGIMGGIMPRKLSNSQARKLRSGYEAAQEKGEVITGFHVNDDGTNAEKCLKAQRASSDLSEEEKKAIEDLKAVRKTDEMLVIRRFGYTEAENPNHAVVIMKGPMACASFMTDNLVPSAKEVLDELVKLAKSSGSLPKMVAVDDKNTANAVNHVTKHADIFTSLYPVPSVEESELINSVPGHALESLKNFNGMPTGFSGARMTSS